MNSAEIRGWDTVLCPLILDYWRPKWLQWDHLLELFTWKSNRNGRNLRWGSGDVECEGFFVLFSGRWLKGPKVELGEDTFHREYDVMWSGRCVSQLDTERKGGNKWLSSTNSFKSEWKKLKINLMNRLHKRSLFARWELFLKVVPAASSRFQYIHLWKTDEKIKYFINLLKLVNYHKHIKESLILNSH